MTFAQELQNSINKNHKLPKKFQINNPLIDISYEYQTKLEELGEDKAKKLLDVYKKCVDFRK